MVSLQFQHPEPFVPAFVPHTGEVFTSEPYFFDQMEHSDVGYTYVFHACRLLRLDLARCKFSGYEDAQATEWALDISVQVEGNEVATFKLNGLYPGHLTVHLESESCYIHPFRDCIKQFMQTLGYTVDYPCFEDVEIHIKTGEVSLGFKPM